MSRWITIYIDEGNIPILRPAEYSCTKYIGGVNKIMLWYIWQLPQHLLGLAVIFFSGAQYGINYHSSKVYRTRYPIGVSLGTYIIVFQEAEETTLKHEYGHSKQSLYLGPFYLLIIGLPSLVMNILSTLNVLDAQRYYTRWPENWADHLGGVSRQMREKV